MRRRLVDDTLVHTSDLDDAERTGSPAACAATTAARWPRRSAWRSNAAPKGPRSWSPKRRYRYDRELGPPPFPGSGGTVPHAALLLCDHAARRPRAGRRQAADPAAPAARPAGCRAA